MKILIATPLYPPEIGGPATYTKILEEELPKQGVDVRVLPFASVRNFPKGIAHCLYVWKLFWAASGVDVILALDPVSVGFPAILVSFIRSKPLVVKIVGDYAWEQGRQRFNVKENLDEFIGVPSNKFPAPVATLRRIQTFVATHAKAVIVPSKYLQGIVHAWGIPNEKISIVYNAFSSVGELPAKAVVRRVVNISGTMLLSAGRLVPWKGFETLIALFPEIKNKFPDAELFIAGSGPLEGSIKKLIVEKNLSECVHCLGNVDHELLMKYIRAADCFVLNTGYEGLSHQLLEVLALGTPIVTTKVGGNPELITDGRTGLLVPYNDPIALEDALVRVLKDKEISAAFAEEGKKFVSAFTVPALIEGTLTVLGRATHL